MEVKLNERNVCAEESDGKRGEKMKQRDHHKLEEKGREISNQISDKEKSRKKKKQTESHGSEREKGSEERIIKINKIKPLPNKREV